MDYKKMYEKEKGIQWLNYSMTSDDWRKRVEWLENLLRSYTSQCRNKGCDYCNEKFDGNN